jgi:putative serine protease PepD
MPRRARRLAGAVVVLALAAGGASGALVSSVMNADSPSAGPTTTVVQIATTAVSPTVRTAAYPDVRAIVASVRQSVVAIDVTLVSYDPRGRALNATSSGTGIVLTSSGMIATNAHVTAGAQRITVTLPDGSKVDGTLVGARTSEDLAVVYVNRTDLVPAVIGRSSAMQVGDLVVAVGNALALEGGPTASLGIVSALNRTITTNDGSTYAHLLQTDAAINSGDSGGPLVNAAGEVIGINSAAALTAENIGFAIAIDIALPILGEIYGG